MKKRFGTFICLCLVLAVLLAPRTFAAEVSATAISLDLTEGSIEIYESEGVTYCVQNEVTQATTGGVIVRQTDNATATANTITVSRGTCKVTIASLKVKAVKSPIDVKTGASLDLNLLGSSTVTGGDYRAGIEVPYGAAITIDGSGSITATGGDFGAGIGGGDCGTGGIITINGGSVTATGGSPGAGIGGGSGGAGGTITVNGGTVTATGGSECAGIQVPEGASITINGGTVTATGGSYGAGIGSCKFGDGGSITINGGTVSAKGGHGGAGIGGGLRSAGGNITVSGGTVTAEGGYGGAGIGGGYGGAGGTITINGGTVTATSGSIAADIGEGRDGTFDAVTLSETVTVTDKKGHAPDVRETIFIDDQPTLPLASNLGNTPATSVTAHNHSGLSYQWQISSDNQNWSDLTGETASATASFAMTEELDRAYLRCKLTNGWGNVEYTDAVQIYVLAFAQQPTSVEANLNDMVAFEAASTCSNVTYQWQRSYDEGASWVDVPGETFSTLIVNATLSESAAKYRCVITATNGDELASDTVSVKIDLGDLVTYTVQTLLQKADGSGYVIESQQVMEGISGATVTAPAASYPGFSENSEKGTPSGTVAADNSLVLTRYFDRETYSITFDTMGGGALPDLEALYGAAIEIPSDPSRYGYDFIGWYADEELTEEYVFDTMPLNGDTVYAKWTPVGTGRGIEYHINGMAIRDSSTFEPLDEIPTDRFLVEVSLTNLEANATDTILLVQYTAEGQMLGMQYVFANMAEGQTMTFGVLVDNRDGQVGRIKAFVLPTLGNPIPLANSAEI